MSAVSGSIESIRAEIASERTQVVVSPYRVCPIGAHSDHQGGPVLGMTVDAHTLLAFAPSASEKVAITSANFDGTVVFDVGSPVTESLPEWGRYPAAAAAAMAGVLPASPRGMTARLEGTLPGGGLSSSASVLLACVVALARANGVTLDSRQTMRLALRAERDFVGVRVGLLDPGTIVFGRKDRLVALDTEREEFERLELGAGAPGYRILAVFSGEPRKLVSSPYNERVEQCFEAVRFLAQRLGRPEARGLNAFADDEFERYQRELPEIPGRRARHFFTERARVREGIEAWKRGRLDRFGELMRASCRSSIESWESGSDELIEVQSILERAPGVFGSRFSGAGFGGCVVALVGEDDLESVRRGIERALAERLPRARTYLLESDDGIRVS